MKFHLEGNNSVHNNIKQILSLILNNNTKLGKF